MLYQLGTITIATPGPFNATDMAEEFGSDFAVKPLVGAMQDREFVGPADNHMTITGTLQVGLFARNGKENGLAEVEALRGITGTGAPQPLVRGDGTNLGYWLVEKVSTKGTSLDLQGVPRIVTYSIGLVRSASSSAPAALVSMLDTLFS